MKSTAHRINRFVASLSIFAMVATSFVPLPALAIAQSPQPKPDLTITKTNDVGGSISLGGSFTWTLHVTNTGAASAVFEKNEKILRDNMPYHKVSDYGSPVVTTGGGVAVDGSIVCNQAGSNKQDLTCTVSNHNGDTVTIPVGGYIDVSVVVTPTDVASLENPRGGSDNTCKVDPSGKVSESSDGNNTCSNTVAVVSPTPTPTPSSTPTPTPTPSDTPTPTPTPSNTETPTPSPIPTYQGGSVCSEGTEPQYVGTHSISSLDADGESFAVNSGSEYLFKASGTFNPTQCSGGVCPNNQWHADAGYTTQNNWSSLAAQYGIAGTGVDYGAHALLGDLGSGVGVVGWGSYNASHSYAFAYTPSASTAQFVVGDRWSSWFVTPWQNQGGMNDNGGSLTLDVYSCEPIRGTLVVNKVVVGGPKIAADFSFTVDDGDTTAFEADGSNELSLPVGAHQR